MLELDDLLAPTPDAAPCGEDMSFSPEFDAIQEARRADDPSLEQGEWVTDLKYADWTSVSKACSALLRSRSKDLRLAVWLSEADTRIEGLVGLTQGYRLIGELCDRYWDELHPRVEDGDLEERIGTITWLLTHSAQWLRQVPLVQGPQGRFGLVDFEAARTRGDIESDLPALDVMEAARRDTPHEFYVDLMERLPECGAALDALQASVDARLGQDGPSFTPLRDQLELIRSTVARFARDAGVLLGGDDDVAPAPQQDTGGEFRSRSSGNGTIDSRREALAQLRKVAEFFRRTEPHSPVAYLADKAARWGEMPLHVWLKRVIKDEAALAQIEELLDSGDGTSISQAPREE